jgi:hypothetical protein
VKLKVPDLMHTFVIISKLLDIAMCIRESRSRLDW